MEILYAILLGLLAGMVMSVMLGTVFFSIVQNSIESGWKTGAKIATGVILCDILFLIFTLAGNTYIEKLQAYERWISIIGGAFLILLGISNIVRKVKESKLNSTTAYMGNGFLLNFLNPVNFAFWVTLSATLGVKYGYGINLKMWFFGFALVGIFFSEVGIAVLASKIKKWMTPIRLKRMNQIVGVAFILFGIRLMV